MIASKTIVCLSVFEFAAACGPLQAQSGSPHDRQESCRNFVQGFYDWYVPKALGENEGPAWAFALKNKRSVFSPELYRLLREDSAAQAKAGEIVGLDFDPFLNSQDPEERYVVGNVTPKGDRYLVELRGISSGKKSEKPAVVAELTQNDGRWLFVNFHYGETKYPEDENLVSVLKNLRASRQKQAK